MPDHYVMNLAAQQDYKRFYDEEIAIRRAMIFPPLCDMCIFCFSGVSESAELSPKTPVRVLGPVRGAYGRINGKFRYRIIMKCKNNAEIRGLISSVLVDSAKIKEMKNITLYADMNGDAGV